MGEVFVIKAIKPQKLRVKKIRQEILNELRKEGTDQKKVLRPTVKTWQGEKPKFESLVGLERPPGGASVLTGPTGSEKGVLKWTWLDQGTKKNYPIVARRKPYLAYRKGGFRAKTVVGEFKSRRGSPATGPLRRPKMVTHPGIKARNWSQILTKQRKKPFTKRMVKAMQRGAKKAYA